MSSGYLQGILPKGTPVIVEYVGKEWPGIIRGSGYQGGLYKYFVYLEDSTGFPKTPEGEKIVVVDESTVKVDVSKIGTE